MNANHLNSSCCPWNPISSRWCQALRRRPLCVWCSGNQIVLLTDVSEARSTLPLWWNNTFANRWGNADAWWLQTIWLRHLIIVITSWTLLFSCFYFVFWCTPCHGRYLTEVPFLVVWISLKPYSN